MPLIIDVSTFVVTGNSVHLEFDQRKNNGLNLSSVYSLESLCYEGSATMCIFFPSLLFEAQIF